MSLCTIALENCVVRPSIDDIEFEVGTEGILKDIWEGIKKFFKALWDGIIGIFNKILELLGFRKKKTEDKIKQADKIIKEIREYHEKKDVAHMAELKARSDISKTERSIDDIKYDLVKKLNDYGLPTQKSISVRYKDTIAKYTSYANYTVKELIKFDKCSFTKNTIEYFNRFLTGHSDTADPVYLDIIKRVDNDNIKISLNSYCNIDYIDSYDRSGNPYFEFNYQKELYNKYKIYIYSISRNMEAMNSDTIFGSEREEFKQFGSVISYYTCLRSVLCTSIVEKDMNHILNEAAKIMYKEKSITDKLLNSHSKYLGDDGKVSEEFRNAFENISNSISIMGTIYRINYKNLIMIANTVVDINKRFINEFDRLFEALSTTYEELRAARRKLGKFKIVHQMAEDKEKSVKM